jgi:hypothetical protein
MRHAVLMSFAVGPLPLAMNRREAPLAGSRRHDTTGSGPHRSAARVLSPRRNGIEADIDRHGSGWSIEGRGRWTHR